jgi:hypothetical protein
VTASLSIGALGSALVWAALDAADRAEDGSITATVRAVFDQMRVADSRIADPGDRDITALLNGEPTR